MMEDTIRSLVMKNVSTTDIKKAAMEQNMKTLREVAADKVLEGETAIEEVLRVTQEDVARSA